MGSELLEEVHYGEEGPHSVVVPIKKKIVHTYVNRRVHYNAYLCQKGMRWGMDNASHRGTTLYR